MTITCCTLNVLRSLNAITVYVIGYGDISIMFLRYGDISITFLHFVVLQVSVRLVVCIMVKGGYQHYSKQSKLERCTPP